MSSRDTLFLAGLFMNILLTESWSIFETEMSSSSILTESLPVDSIHRRMDSSMVTASLEKYQSMSRIEKKILGTGLSMEYSSLSA